MDIGESLPDEVLPPYVPKWQMECIDFYKKVSTQWIVGGMGYLVGLNYLSIIEIAKIYDFELNPHRMTILRTIEHFIKERSNKDVKR